MNSTELCAITLFFIGMLGVIALQNVIKTIMSVCIMEVAVILFFLSINFEPGVAPPIGETLQKVADPFPQALMITAIVIGVAVTALAVSMFNGLYHKYGTTSWLKALAARKKEDNVQ